MLLHRWSPRDVPQAETTSQRRGILIGIATYKLPGARCPPPYALIQEYQAYTRHLHHPCPLPPIRHSQPEYTTTNLLTICLQFVRRAPIFSFSLPVFTLPPFLLPSLSLAPRLRLVQVPGGAASEPLAAVSRSPRRCAAGSRAALVTEYNKPGGSRPAAHPQPRSPELARTLFHSRVQLLGDSSLPSANGSSSPLHPGVLGLLLPPPPAVMLLSQGKVGWPVQSPNRGRALPLGRHTPPLPGSARPAPGSRMRWSLEEPGAGAWSLSGRLPVPPGDARPLAFLRSSKAPAVTHPLGEPFHGVHLPGVEEERNGREPQRGDELHWPLTFA